MFLCCGALRVRCDIVFFCCVLLCLCVLLCSMVVSRECVLFCSDVFVFAVFVSGRSARLLIVLFDYVLLCYVVFVVGLRAKCGV